MSYIVSMVIGVNEQGSDGREGGGTKSGIKRDGGASEEIGIMSQTLSSDQLGCSDLKI